MSRDVSTNYKTQANKQEITARFFTLITLNYTGASSPIRIVNNYESIDYDGDTFSAWAFRFTMPQDAEGKRTARLEIDNVDRSITEFILDAGVKDITATEQLVYYDGTTATLEIERSYTMQNITITRKTISGELVYQQYLHDAFPKLIKTPSKFPGVF